MNEDQAKMTNSLPDPDGQPTPPRVYPRLMKRLRLGAYLALAGSVVILSGGAYEMLKARALIQNGVKTVGTLFDHDSMNTGKGRTSYNIVVDYDPQDGPGYRRQFVVSKTQFEKALAVKKLDITYDPSNPENSAIGDKIAYNLEPFVMGLGLAAFSGFAFWYHRKKLRDVESFVSADV